MHLPCGLPSQNFVEILKLFHHLPSIDIENAGERKRVLLRFRILFNANVLERLLPRTLDPTAPLRNAGGKPTSPTFQLQVRKSLPFELGRKRASPMLLPASMQGQLTPGWLSGPTPPSSSLQAWERL